jgi:hypothetical protein
MKHIAGKRKSVLLKGRTLNLALLTAIERESPKTESSAIPDLQRIADEHPVFVL